MAAIDHGSTPSPAEATAGLQVLNILADLAVAGGADIAVSRFREAYLLLGADAGVFLSFVRDGATRTSYRSLLACDPLWAVEYARRGWYDHDPWLRYATQETEPIRSGDLTLLDEERDFIQVSATLGFASAIVVPAPSSAGSSRVGVLCLGSNRPDQFDGEGLDRIRILARALAMELHRWLLQDAREDLIERSRITPADIELLRHEEVGHTSKIIGAALNIEPKTVDCRFQRVIAKLEAPDRRTAARIARLYGLFSLSSGRT